jgi:DNA-binding SARP family transcriptional activator
VVAGADGSIVQFRRRERALLSVLLMHARQPCTTGMLSLSIWDEHQPDHPECALRTYVSRIRAALPADFPESFLVTLDGAYRVDPPPGTLDMDLFGQLHAEATDAAGRGDLRAAANLLQPGSSLLDFTAGHRSPPRPARHARDRVADSPPVRAAPPGRAAAY